MSATTFSVRVVQRPAAHTIQEVYRIYVREARRHPRPFGPYFLDPLNAREFATRHGMVGQLESAVLASCYGRG
jgi:hypothetical protein